MCANKWLIVNRIICVWYKYLKPFNCVLKNALRLVYKCYLQNMFTNHLYLIYMYKEDFALNNLQWLIYHKTQRSQIIYCPVGWGFRIHRLHLFRGVRHPYECPDNESKQSDGEVSVMLGLWGMRNTPSLSLFPGLFW